MNVNKLSMFIRSLDKEEYFQNSDRFEIQYLLDRIKKEAFNMDMYCYNIVIKFKTLYIRVNYEGSFKNILNVIDVYQRVIDEKFPNGTLGDVIIHNNILIDFILRKECKIN